METQTTNQWQSDHGRWLEANVGQQYRKGLDRLLCINYVNSTDNNQPWKLKLAVGSRPGSILAFQDLYFNQCRHLVAAQKARTSSLGQLGSHRPWSHCRWFVVWVSIHIVILPLQMLHGDLHIPWGSDTNGNMPTPSHSISDAYQPWERAMWRRLALAFLHALYALKPPWLTSTQCPTFLGSYMYQVATLVKA